MDPSWLPPTVIAIPLIGACLVLALAQHTPRLVVDVAALVTALFTVAGGAVLLVVVGAGRVVTRVGGWTPQIGIVLVADPIGTALALLAAILTACALLYTWRYFDSAEAHVHVLLLLFLAGMVGFALTADLFDLFVFFELMGAAAYALTGHKIEEPQAVHGGFAFGVVNSLGAYFSLTGIALLYARTGRLGLAPLGAALTGRGADVLVLAAMVLVLTGLLVKAAIVPFHFWLADAHAVAPSPVCALFSGVMAPLGLYGVVRVYVTVFGAAVPAVVAHRTLVGLGVVTAGLGAVMCLAQRHLKRMLAYSTIAHLGLFLVGMATLSGQGMAGSMVYLLGHAGVKGALFLLVGLLLARHGNVDEVGLHGRGRADGVARWLFVLAALALAGLPPFGTGLGKAISEEAAERWWLVGIFVLVSAATGGAALRAGLRVHFGLGKPPTDADPDTTSGEDEAQEGRFPARIPMTMVVPVVVLLVGAVAIGVVPAVADRLAEGGRLFVDQAGYLEAVTHGAAATQTPAPARWWTLSGVALGVLSTALAVTLALLAVHGRFGWLGRLLDTPLRTLHRAHSGHVGDYVAWLLGGVAVLSGLLILPALP
ncbi:MAG: NADH dehydrogenase [Kutzneria sp.]|nr:NADH dehydrogenase [Kutzneria sp.]